METLVYKREYNFFSEYKIFLHVGYYESVWGKKKYKDLWLGNKGWKTHILRSKYTFSHDLSQIKIIMTYVC